MLLGMTNGATPERRPLPPVVTALAEGLAATLEGRLLAVYLGGSASMGDWVAATSDYDVLVVTEGELSPQDLAAVRLLHERLLEAYPDATRLEGDYAPRHLIVPQGTLAPAPEVREGCFSPDSEEVMLSADNIANMRLHGIPAHGPPPRELLPEVTREDVRAAVREMLSDVPESCLTEAEAAGEILDVARSLAALESGEPTTKGRGAAWALGHLDPRWRPAISLALGVRNGESAPEAERTLRDALSEMVRALRSGEVRVQPRR